MARDEAYRKAEEKIHEARRYGAIALGLSNLGLTEIPESLGQLTRLERLDLSDNRLTALPVSLGQLTQLLKLDVSGNLLKGLPEWLGRLTQLHTLDLADNRLTRVPESLGRLRQLLSLRLSSNHLTALPESLAQLAQLGILFLKRNRLTALPEWLGQLTQLQSLGLDYNQLTALPESLGQLTELRALDLSGNQLTVLPQSLGQLSQLLTLKLDNNQLTALPESLGQLTYLQTLYVARNGLRALPESLKRLKRLESLDLRGIPALNIPIEVAEKCFGGAQEILDYYFSTRGDQGSALRELKLLVVGRGGTGKTSLVRRLKGLPLDPGESETHGINISPLELKCHDGPVSARVWDFGGQHVLHAMHEFFLTARSLYLLVLVERDDMAERDAAYWLQLIRSYAGSAPVVVALNKSRGGRLRAIDRDSLEHNYGPILAWVPTECSDGFDGTIDDLRSALTAAADGMQEVRDVFPSKWRRVKEWLENMGEPYLDFVTYQERCRDLGETHDDQQEKLAAWLNDLGIAINYANDERLHDTTVLRPDWLANGIYAILRANDSHHERPLAPDAVLTADRLGPIYAAAERLKMLRAADYPAEKWPFLLRLMNLFQLAFPIDDRGQTLLAPTLLPPEPPPNCEEPEDADRTRLRYEFAVVPGPLVPKLLVRSFSLIDDERHWRRGAILRFGEARARVWVTQDERWIHVTAIGNQDDRTELLTMIRVAIRELLAEYKDLSAVEQWEYNNEWVPRRTLEQFGVLPKSEIDDTVDDGKGVK